MSQPVMIDVDGCETAQHLAAKHLHSALESVNKLGGPPTSSMAQSITLAAVRSPPAKVANKDEDQGRALNLQRQNAQFFEIKAFKVSTGLQKYLSGQARPVEPPQHEVISALDLFLYICLEGGEFHMCVSLCSCC